MSKSFWSPRKIPPDLHPESELTQGAGVHVLLTISAQSPAVNPFVLCRPQNTTRGVQEC